SISEIIKVQLFIKGLCSELFTTLAPLTIQTLEEYYKQKLEANKNSTKKNKKNNNIEEEIVKEEFCKIDIKMSKISEGDKTVETMGLKKK
ncbi:35275_t:CDS:2, partial [Gigaspora margarita]